MRRGICWMFIAILLSGCGWHLQAVHPLPAELSPVYLQLTDTHSIFARSLQAKLEAAGIQTTQDFAHAGAVLSITQDKSNRQISSVSAFNQPQQYQIDYQIEFALDRHHKEASAASTTAPTRLIASQLITASRTMSYDVNLALAKDREARSIEELLAEQLTQQVLRRLNYLPVAVVPSK